MTSERSEVMKYYRLGSGEPVYDHAESHVRDHGTVEPLLAEAIERIQSLDREIIVDEIDFGRVIGENNCVRTEPGDDIVYAKRPKRKGVTRFVRNRKPEPTTKVTMVLTKDPDYFGAYKILTAFLGDRAEPEPWDPAATARSIRFWNTHALAWGSCPTILGTERV